MYCERIMKTSNFLALVISFVSFSLLAHVTAYYNELADHASFAEEDIQEAEQAIFRALQHLRECKQRGLSKPVDCEEHFQRGNKGSGEYTIWPRSRVGDNRSLTVYCDMTTDGGGWTVIQRRGDYGRAQDYFFKDWDCYKRGFGDVKKDFWLGNDAIFALSNQRQYSIRFDLTDFESNSVYAFYDKFWIAGEEDGYKLNIKDYTGNAGDSMAYHDGRKFETKSIQETDEFVAKNCADHFKGAWWYNACHVSNLNGLYKRGAYNDSFADGIVWTSWKGHQYSLRTTEIKIRPKDFRKSRIQLNET